MRKSIKINDRLIFSLLFPYYFNFSFVNSGIKYRFRFFYLFFDFTSRYLNCCYLWVLDSRNDKLFILLLYTNKKKRIFDFSFFFQVDMIRLDWIKETENSKLLINKWLKSNLFNIFQTLDWSKTLKYIGSILISVSFRRKQREK